MYNESFISMIKIKKNENLETKLHDFYENEISRNQHDF